MEDRLTLGLPNADVLEAPKKRFELVERGSQVNSNLGVPLVIAAFVGLLKQIFQSDEDKQEPEPKDIGSPHPQQVVQSSEKASQSVDAADSADLDKVVRIADFLKAATQSKPVFSGFDIAQFAFTETADSLPQSAFRSSFAQLTSDTASIAQTASLTPVSGTGGFGGNGSLPVANDNGSGGAPLGTSAPRDPTDPETSTENGSSGTDTDGSEASDTDPETDEDDTPIGPSRVNRRPILNGPVYLDNGLLNLSIIVSMGELLTGASDPDGDMLIVRSLTADTGTLERIGIDRWLYTPARDETGPVTFHYQISDGTEAIEQIAHLEIQPANGGEIVGTEGDDLLLGTPYADLIEARGGDDVVYGRESDDVIHGGDGDDRLIGGDGDDIMWGGRGNDILFGGRGNDTLFGEDGNDILYGDAGDDHLLGGAGDDEAHGGEGNDVVEGGSGADKLHGDAGDDFLDGGEGADYLDGGDGADIVIAGGGNDEALGGDGNDILYGDAGDDHLLGGAGDDEAHGGEGNDVVEGGSGADVLHGDAGDDYLDGGEGADYLDGGDGADIVIAGGGNDEALGGDGNDILYGNAGDDHLLGGAGDDEVHGGEGDDVVEGGSGADFLDGGSGKDVLFDGAGIDRVEAGEGDDRIVLCEDGESDWIDGGAGADTLDLSDVVFDATIDLPDGWVVIDGFEEARLFEIENVRGGHGRDRLVADDEVNIMVGGDGNDTFVFRSLSALTNDGGPRDHIMDFDTGDRIDLSRVMRDLDDFAAQKLFFAGAASSSVNDLGAITYDNRFIEDDHEITVVAGNLDDDANSEFEIVLEGHHDLTERDFILAARDMDAHS